jgi:hypothetical protein
MRIDEARYPAEADLYILTPHMCDVVIAAKDHEVTLPYKTRATSAHRRSSGSHKNLA